MLPNGPQVFSHTNRYRCIVIKLRDEFLSEEDLDLKNMTREELFAYWNMWLEQAQATNDKDKHLFSHGVFTREPAISG